MTDAHRILEELDEDPSARSRSPATLQGGETPPPKKKPGVLTSKRRPHGEVVVVYPQELLGFSHGRFGHVGAAFVNGAARTETEERSAWENVRVFFFSAGSEGVNHEEHKPSRLLASTSVHLGLPSQP